MTSDHSLLCISSRHSLLPLLHDTVIDSHVFTCLSFTDAYCSTSRTGVSCSRHLLYHSPLSATLFFTNTISTTPQLTSTQSLMCTTSALTPYTPAHNITRPLSLTIFPPSPLYPHNARSSHPHSARCSSAFKL